ncbi:LysR family transcriptional regulator [Pokkaliibacter sp. CJK22405]|uniref:LysR family transcriptional regulator n=1 Tax=Pokkaliibacter sp. CJK22405 TaxID=3384615 RepID=UPI0039848D98
MSTLDNVNLRSLRFFIAVCDCLSYSEVARRENVSPSMISRVIRQLEDSLGQQLFYRNTRALMPTEAARLLIDPARDMLARFDHAQQHLAQRSQSPSGIIRLNAPVYFGQRHIAPWLPTLLERYPKLQIELSLTDDFIDPHSQAADLIFRIATPEDSSLQGRVISPQRYFLAATADYLARAGIPVHPQELQQHHCLVYGGSSGRNRWLYRHGQGGWHQQQVTPAMLSNDAQSLLVAALNHAGVVLFPDWLIGEYLKEGKLTALLPEYDVAIGKTPQSLSLIYPNTHLPSLNVRTVIDFFVEVFGTPPYWSYESDQPIKKRP